MRAALMVLALLGSSVASAEDRMRFPSHLHAMLDATDLTQEIHFGVEVYFDSSRPESVSAE